MSITYTQAYYLIGLVCSTGLAAVFMFWSFVALRRGKKAAKLTPAQIAAQKEDEELFKAIRKEAVYLAREIPEAMGVQNRFAWNYHEYRNDGKGKKRKKSLIRFSAVLLTRTEIWFKFDGKRLPYGTSFADIKKPENNVIENLQYAIRRPCMFHEDSLYNFFLRVGLKNSIMGIPKIVKWIDIVGSLPKHNSFALPMGVNEYNKLIYQDFTQWPHLIIAGSTGMGKTTQLFNWLATLIKRNSPDHLHLILVDLKEGIAFYQFKDVPHVQAMIDNKPEVQQALDALVEETDKRMQMFKGVCQDLRGWNAQAGPGKQLPYTIMIIDELAQLMFDSTYKKPSQEALSILATKARAAGIHLILCTQIVEAAVLTLQIRGNFPVRIAYGVPGFSESNLILNNGAAAGLDHPGRCIYKRGARTFTLQTPYATEQEIEQVIKEATGEIEPATPGYVFDELDVLRVALHNFNGAAQRSQLYAAMGEEVPRDTIKTILSKYEYDYTPEAVIEIDGGRYILAPGRGSKPRQLIPVNGTLPQTPEELKSWRLAVDDKTDAIAQTL